MFAFLSVVNVCAALTWVIEGWVGVTYPVLRPKSRSRGQIQGLRHGLRVVHIIAFMGERFKIVFLLGGDDDDKENCLCIDYNIVYCIECHKRCPTVDCHWKDHTNRREHEKAIYKDVETEIDDEKMLKFLKT